jgi:hypothetical protein
VTCCETPDWVAFSRSAARVNERSSATAMTARICRSEMRAADGPAGDVRAADMRAGDMRVVMAMRAYVTR